MLLLCACTLSANCQTMTRDANGNYHKVVKPKGNDAQTKYTYDDGKFVYPIWKSAGGKFYYFKRSKNGNIYKVYLHDGQ